MFVMPKGEPAVCVDHRCARLVGNSNYRHGTPRHSGSRAKGAVASCAVKIHLETMWASSSLRGIVRTSNLTGIPSHSFAVVRAYLALTGKNTNREPGWTRCSPEMFRYPQHCPCLLGNVLVSLPNMDVKKVPQQQTRIWDFHVLG